MGERRGRGDMIIQQLKCPPLLGTGCWMYEHILDWSPVRETFPRNTQVYVVKYIAQNMNVSS